MNNIENEARYQLAEVVDQNYFTQTPQTLIAFGIADSNQLTIEVEGQELKAKTMETYAGGLYAYWFYADKYVNNEKLQMAMYRNTHILTRHVAPDFKLIENTLPF